MPSSASVLLAFALVVASWVLAAWTFIPPAEIQREPQRAQAAAIRHHHAKFGNCYIPGLRRPEAGPAKTVEAVPPAPADYGTLPEKTRDGVPLELGMCVWIVCRVNGLVGLDHATVTGPNELIGMHLASRTFQRIKAPSEIYADHDAAYAAM